MGQSPACLDCGLGLTTRWVRLALHVSPRSAVFFRNSEFIIRNSHAPRAPLPRLPLTSITCPPIAEWISAIARDLDPLFPRGEPVRDGDADDPEDPEVRDRRAGELD